MQYAWNKAVVSAVHNLQKIISQISAKYDENIKDLRRDLETTETEKDAIINDLRNQLHTKETTSQNVEKYKEIYDIKLQLEVHEIMKQKEAEQSQLQDLHTQLKNTQKDFQESSAQAAATSVRDNVALQCELQEDSTQIQVLQTQLHAFERDYAIAVEWQEKPVNLQTVTYIWNVSIWGNVKESYICSSCRYMDCFLLGTYT